MSSRIIKKDKPELTEAEMAELDALILLPDDRVDTSVIPEIFDRAKSIRGFFIARKSGIFSLRWMILLLTGSRKIPAGGRVFTNILTRFCWSISDSIGSAS